MFRHSVPLLPSNSKSIVLPERKNSNIKYLILLVSLKKYSINTATDLTYALSNKATY